jgi:hypothetical protein
MKNDPMTDTMRQPGCKKDCANAIRDPPQGGAAIRTRNLQCGKRLDHIMSTLY